MLTPLRVLSSRGELWGLVGVLLSPAFECGKERTGAAAVGSRRPSR